MARYLGRAPGGSFTIPILPANHAAGMYRITVIVRVVQAGAGGSTLTLNLRWTDESAVIKTFVIANAISLSSADGQPAQGSYNFITNGNAQIELQATTAGAGTPQYDGWCHLEYL